MILDAINDVTAQVFPGRVTYRDAWPEQFERPSLFLVAERRRMVGGTAFLCEYEQVFGVQINDAVDDHYEADTDRLTEETDRLLDAFSGGALHLTQGEGDRALHLTQEEGERGATTSAVKLTLHWFEDRPRRTETAPPMRGVEVETVINPEPKPTMKE